MNFYVTENPLFDANVIVLALEALQGRSKFELQPAALSDGDKKSTLLFKCTVAIGTTDHDLKEDSEDCISSSDAVSHVKKYSGEKHTFSQGNHLRIRNPDLSTPHSA